MPKAAHLAASRALRGVAAVCALIVWLLGFFAASSQLHGSVHHEADHAGHTCAITFFSAGLDDPLGCTGISVIPALFPVSETPADLASPLPDADGRLPPGCGPPLC